MGKNNGRFRKNKVYFSQVSNSALRDTNLSLKAKGLYSLIQSYITIENFTLYKTTLKKQCKEKEKAFESTWKELKENGYLIQYRLQGEKGYFYYEYELLNEKNIDLANKIHSQQNRKKYDEKIHIPKKVVMDETTSKTISPKKEVMDNGGDGKGGGYNNTDLSNIDLSNTDLNNNNNTKKIINSNNEFKNIENNVVVNKVKDIFLEDITDKEAVSLLAAAKNNLDLIKEKYILVKQKNNIKNLVGWIISAIKKDYKDSNIKNCNNTNTSNKSVFNNYEQRKYDFNKLEKGLLGWDKNTSLEDCYK